MAEEEHQQSPNRPTRDTAQLQTQSDDDDGDFMPPLSRSHILRRIQRRRDNITRHVSNATERQSQREENGRVGTPSGRSNTLIQR